MLYPIPPRNTFGKASYAYWENFLTDVEIRLMLSQTECDHLQQGCIGGNGGASEINLTKRASLVAWLHTKPELNEIWCKFANVFAEVNSRYFHYELNGFYEPMQISFYTSEQQGHYTWHTDAAPEERLVPRKLSMAMLLSDPKEFEGGELQILNGDKEESLPMQKGRAWFFPSYVLHRVTPVTKGIRKSLVLWSGGPEFR